MTEEPNLLRIVNTCDDLTPDQKQAIGAATEAVCDILDDMGVDFTLDLKIRPRAPKTEEEA